MEKASREMNFMLKWRENGLLVVRQDRNDKDIFNEPMIFVLL